MSNKNTWYLPGPFHQYQEDVKALAKSFGLRIIDANATESREDEAEDVPEVTIREMAQPPAPGAGQGDQVDTDELAAQNWLPSFAALPDSSMLPRAWRRWNVLALANWLSAYSMC
jgi:hypothetical protein